MQHLDVWYEELKDLFVFFGAAKASFDAGSAFQACAFRKWEVLCAFLAYRLFAFRA
jgi:hypothetical protein